MEEYTNDFEDCFSSELVQFSELYKTVSGTGKVQELHNTSTELSMLLMLNENMCTQSFPNVHIALRIYLCMATSNCSGERSFSKLKRIKNEVCSCVGQQLLSLLSLMSIENDIVQRLSFTDIINEFATKKVRKHSM